MFSYLQSFPSHPHSSFASIAPDVTAAWRGAPLLYTVSCFRAAFSKQTRTGRKTLPCLVVSSVATTESGPRLAVDGRPLVLLRTVPVPPPATSPFATAPAPFSHYPLLAILELSASPFRIAIAIAAPITASTTKSAILFAWFVHVRTYALVLFIVFSIISKSPFSQTITHARMHTTPARRLCGVVAITATDTRFFSA